MMMHAYNCAFSVFLSVFLDSLNMFAEQTQVTVWDCSNK